MDNNRIISVDLGELFHYLISKIPIFLICGIIFAGLGYEYADMNSGTPMYPSTVKMYVTGVQTATPSASAFNLGSAVITNYVEIMNSAPVLDSVISNLGLNMTSSELRRCISTNQPKNTAMLEVTVMFPNAEWAKAVVDELVYDASAYALEVMGATPPKIYEESSVANNPSIANQISKSKYTALGFACGALLSGFIFFLAYFFRKKIDTPAIIDTKLHLETLGIVSNITTTSNYLELYSRLVKLAPSHSIFAFVQPTHREQFENGMLEFAEAVSTVQEKVAVVIPGENNAWIDYAKGEKNFKEVSSVTETGLTCFEMNVSSKDIYFLESDAYLLFLDKLRNEFSYIFILVSDYENDVESEVIAKKADSAVLLLSSKHSRSIPTKSVLCEMNKDGVPLLGAVLFDIRLKHKKSYFVKKYSKFLG